MVRARLYPDKSRDREPQQITTVAALGLTQIFAWGCSYYLPAVLATWVAVGTGWPLAWVVGGLSLGLVVAGLVSPTVGRLIQDYGGRWVLAISSVLLALGLVVVGLSQNLMTYLTGWTVIGLGMGAGLYDAAFATLGRIYREKARHAIGVLTLFAGFSSTICWPLTWWLVQMAGWRATCFIYAGLQLLMSLPIYLVFVPSLHKGLAHSKSEIHSVTPSRTASPRQKVFLLAGLPEAKRMIVPVLATNNSESHLFYALTNKALYRSPDAGQHWEQMNIPWKREYQGQHQQAILVTDSL